jgi:crotonobetainyl-CoA:carnitine CoA-transferase CaiB-like acyl-CoA transferase
MPDHDDGRCAPLGGLHVLDFTQVVAGPYCTLILADLGAEVIKVERPGKGDDARSFGPPYVAGQSTYFAGLNRAKKSVVLDLGREEGRSAARRLARTADILVENFRPGVMERAGLEYEAVAAENPRLIYCSITGYGKDGPYRDRAAYDVAVAAMGGMMSITGSPGQAPVKTGVAVLDIATGLYAYGAITTALYQRERTGRGQRIDISMLEVQVANLINAASAYLLAGEVMGPQGSSHPSMAPYQAFPAADGWVIIGALNDRMFDRLCHALDRPRWASDQRFASNADRVANRDPLVRLISDVTRTRPVQWWVDELGRSGVAVAPVNTIDKVFDDPQVRHSGIVKVVDDPRLGRVPVVETPLHFSAARVEASGRVPFLGEDTDEVLAEIREDHFRGK